MGCFDGGVIGWGDGVLYCFDLGVSGGWLSYGWGGFSGASVFVLLLLDELQVSGLCMIECLAREEDEFFHVHLLNFNPFLRLTVITFRYLYAIEVRSPRMGRYVWIIDVI